METFAEFSKQTLYLAALAWGVVQGTKYGWPGVNAPFCAFLVACGLGVAAYVSGYVSGHAIEVVGQVLLATLGASGLHNYLYRAGVREGEQG